MPASPSSSAQAAREAVAARLRDLRKGAGLTVAELAGLCGWHHSKTSRIENARTAPSARDIHHWCRACGRPDEAPDLVVRSVNAESMYSEWRHQIQGLKKLQNSWPQVFQETRLFRIYSSTLVPGLLQTEGYAGGLLGTIARFRGYAEEGAEAAHARVDRSRVIHDQGRRAVFLVEEAALYYRMGNPDDMAAQLGYLLTAGALPAVSLGVIPRAVEPRTVWPLETFHVYDDTFVSVELLSAEVNITQPSEIALYLKAFEQLRGMAVYGATARSLVVNAIEALGHA
ncbi:helix-turn-helix domain-containing protein [Streptomyces antarcticus]|uniref:helix-turn-helix domain-containing protein n=1 Tax=Streptomyces antarcticus TaxID=2996458 RepID=UPI00226E238D|nr:MULTISPECIES: helix-turn-helix transcriptional regulator [unclassified Streptomyces]MCY0943524.1 helix-turn-helix transcriptional regulator [Streptomyces sp. H34-AA3]MCZ4083567.1 helix-turn-helix transcriptional regulator [Streptomyces sp. H34-S5]